MGIIGLRLFICVALVSLAKGSPVHYIHGYNINEDDYEEANKIVSFGDAGSVYREKLEANEEKYEDSSEDIKRINDMCSRYENFLEVHRHSRQKFAKKIVAELKSLWVYFENQIAIARRRQKEGHEFAYDNLSVWRNPAMKSLIIADVLIGEFISKIISNLEDFNDFVLNDEVLWEETIAKVIDQITALTKQNNWENGGGSQFEAEAECLYDLIKNEWNYTVAGMSKNNFMEKSENLANSLELIAGAKGVEYSIKNIAEAILMKTKRIKRGMLQAVDVISSELGPIIDVVDRSVQVGIWKTAMADESLLPRLDDLVTQVESEHFWIKAERFLLNMLMEKIEPPLVTILDFVYEISNEVEIAKKLDAVVAIIDEAISSENIERNVPSMGLKQYLVEILIYFEASEPSEMKNLNNRNAVFLLLRNKFAHFAKIAITWPFFKLQAPNFAW